MNPEQPLAPGQPIEDDLTWRDRFRPAAYVAGIALVANVVLYGCTAAMPDDSGDSTIIMPWQKVSEAPVPLSEACAITGAAEPLPSERKAADCLAYHQDTDIALVYYAGDKDAVTEYSELVEEQLSEQTRGLLRVDITPVAAHPSVLADYNARFAERGCALDDVVKDRSSVIARDSKDMPELAAYDAVVGMGYLPSCNNVVYGIANGSESIVDVFGTYVTENQPYREFDVITGAHEVAHLFGIGHPGLMTWSEAAVLSDGTGRGSLGVIASDTPHGGSIDIIDWVEQSDFKEYGQHNMMSNTEASVDGSSINLLQQYLLEWPERAFGEESIRGTNLEEGSATFGADDEQPQVAYLALGGYMAPLDRLEDKAARFTYLALATHPRRASQETAVDVYVSRPSSGNVALLGTIWALEGDSKQFTLSAGADNTINVAIDAAQDTIAVSHATSGASE